MDLSRFGLVDWDWRFLYMAQLGERGYNDYFVRVWGALDRLGVNEYYDVVRQVREEDWDLFIKVCCQYILTHNEYEFSNDYTRIIRRECFIVAESHGQPAKKVS